MSKGIIKLSPVTNPAKGMKVVWGDNVLNPLTIDKISKLNVEFNGSKGLVNLTKMMLLPFTLSELKQIVIRVYDGKRPAFKEIPLQEGDWEWAIGHIDEEVEIETGVTHADRAPNGFEEYATLSPRAYATSTKDIGVHGKSPITTEEELEDKILSILKEIFVRGQDFDTAAMIRNQQKLVLERRKK